MRFLCSNICSVGAALPPSLKGSEKSVAVALRKYGELLSSDRKAFWSASALSRIPAGRSESSFAGASSELGLLGRLNSSSVCAWPMMFLAGRLGSRRS